MHCLGIGFWVGGGGRVGRGRVRGSGTSIELKESVVGETQTGMDTQGDAFCVSIRLKIYPLVILQCEV